MSGPSTLGVCLALAIATAAYSAESRLAQVLWSGTDTFSRASATNALACESRGSAKIGEISMPGIFLHPRNAQRAVLRYPPVQLPLKAGARAFLLSQVGVSEGFDWKDPEHKPDGVRFYLQYGDRDVASMYLRESKWAPLAAALTPENAALNGAISLATDPGPAGNSSYDWALFGQPIVVALPDQPLPPNVAVNGSTGVLVVDKAGDQTIIEGLDAAGNALPGAATAVHPADAGGLTYTRFDFSGTANCVAWRWRGEGPAWGGSWEPELELDTFVLSRNVVNVPSAKPYEARVTVRNAGLGTLLPDHAAEVTLGRDRQEIRSLAPGATQSVAFRVPPPAAADPSFTAELSWSSGGERQSTSKTATIHQWGTLPPLPKGRPAAAEAKQVGGFVLLRNPRSCWVIDPHAPGLGALVYVWNAGWKLAGSVAPWLQIVDAAGHEVAPGLSRFTTGSAAEGATFAAEGAAGKLKCSVQAILPRDAVACLVTVRVTADADSVIRGVRGPAVHAGDCAFGSKKSTALFPGLEYLEGDEVSSSDRDLAPPLSDRRVPHKFKVTVPMMTVQGQDGAVLGVMWDANQKWDGEHTAPGACFGSPDLITGYDSHLMQLQLPSTPDGVPENQRQAAEPVTLKAGQTWTLTQHLVAAQGSKDGTEPLVWFDKLVGYPQAEAGPRSFAEEMALCRHGFLVTVWDEESHKGRHVVGWGPANSPGHATLMLMDARTVAQGEDRQRLLERVDLVGNQTIQQEGPPGLASRANCHIMGWEFPYHWGGLPGALTGMQAAAAGAIKSQEKDGGWAYHPGKDREKLGAPGTQTMGTCGGNALWLARWAAISGDPAALEALRKAMDRLRQFRVPRGAQGWECPILEPDVLAAAMALRAAVWAYMATGEPRYLDDARCYARTGLAFQYAWDDGKHPGMRYASIPVFGSTFFTHSWIGLPVQWCGLVHAYGLVELLRFDKNDLWERQVDGMVASGMHQQWPMDNKDLAGTYPDSYGQWFTVRNGVYINPENIELNLMARRGLDPGLRSVAVQVAGRTWHVTAPCDVEVMAQGKGARIALKYLPGETVYLTVGGFVPTATMAVSANGQELAKQADLPHGTTGWALREDLGIVVIGGKCDEQGRLEVVVRR